jgi:hypothetical protein
MRQGSQCPTKEQSPPGGSCLTKTLKWLLSGELFAVEVEPLLRKPEELDASTMYRVNAQGFRPRWAHRGRLREKKLERPLMALRPRTTYVREFPPHLRLHESGTSRRGTQGENRSTLTRCHDLHTRGSAAWEHGTSDPSMTSMCPRCGHKSVHGLMHHLSSSWPFTLFPPVGESKHKRYRSIKHEYESRNFAPGSKI